MVVVPEKQITATRAPLYARFEELGLSWRTMDHPPVFTVEESAEIKSALPGGHSKNLFLKDKAGKLTLAIAHAQTRVDLKALGKTLRAKSRFSFGAPDLMTDILGVIPGAVTPFALLNDVNNRIAEVILDTALLAHDPIWFHPLENTASTAVTPQDLQKFISACGTPCQIMDLANPPAPESS